METMQLLMLLKNLSDEVFNAWLALRQLSQIWEALKQWTVNYGKKLKQWNMQQWQESEAMKCLTLHRIALSLYRFITLLLHGFRSCFFHFLLRSIYESHSRTFLHIARHETIFKKIIWRRNKTKQCLRINSSSNLYYSWIFVNFCYKIAWHIYGDTSRISVKKSWDRIFHDPFENVPVSFGGLERGGRIALFRSIRFWTRRKILHLRFLFRILQFSLGAHPKLLQIFFITHNLSKATGPNCMIFLTARCRISRHSSQCSPWSWH
jgi:hypothetical protein